MMRWFAVLLSFAALDAHAADIAIALTDERVDVDTVFSGAQLTLFGVVTGVDNPQTDVDVVAIVEGPQTTFTIREIEKRNLIWSPGPAHRIERAPGLYLTSATRTIAEIAPAADRERLGLGADFLKISVEGAKTHETAALFAAAFLTEAEDRGLYADATGAIAFRKGGLFTVRLDLPATTPVGQYSVRVFLYRGGEQLGADGATLTVDKVGMERQIFEFAHNKPISYGIVCVSIALLAGWFAAFAFRK